VSIALSSLCKRFDEILVLSTMTFLRRETDCTFGIKNLDVMLEEQFHLLAERSSFAFSDLSQS
jgi:hypothetical protein